MHTKGQWKVGDLIRRSWARQEVLAFVTFVQDDIVVVWWFPGEFTGNLGGTASVVNEAILSSYTLVARLPEDG